MATKYSTLERYSVQGHTYTIIEATTVQARCQGRMTIEQFEAKLVEMFDLYCYPDPDQRLDFWMTVEDEIETAPEPEPVKTVYDLAQDAVTSRRGSFPAEVVNVARHDDLRIYLSRVGEEVYMTATNGTERAKVRVAFLSPTTGWTFILSTWGYKLWVERCERIE